VYRLPGGEVDLDRVAEHFAGRCRAVVRVPFDPHLEEGAEIALGRSRSRPGPPCWCSRPLSRTASRSWAGARGRVMALA